MKKLLITGISGFLGQHLAQFAQQHWSLTGLYYKNKITIPGVECLPCDITDPHGLKKVFEKVQPQAMIHLAALSQPNYCETHPQESRSINVDAPTRLARICREKEIPFIFTSTDLVFDGEKAPYRETDEPKPLMMYGKHKAEAERLVTDIYPEAIIARLPVMFGQGGFMINWVETLKNGGTISAFRDEFRSLVSARAVTEGLFLLLNQKVSGIWHLGGIERISRYEFAVKMAEAYGLPLENIIPSLRQAVKIAAARPADVCLDSQKAFELGYQPGSITEELQLLNN